MITFTKQGDSVHHSIAMRPDFLLVDSRDFFSDLWSGGEKKGKKSSEKDQLIGHFQSFFSFSELFLIQ